MSFESEHALAVLVDIENLARPGARNRDEFDIHLVLGRLAEKGRVVIKRAYADWSRYRDARRELMNAGLELIEMPSSREGAKNRADIKMAVDAMEIAYSRSHVTNFVIVSGDSDFTPLVGKLRELNKRVIGIGRNETSASPLLIANCDEFYFYDSMASKAPRQYIEGQRPDALSLLRETLEARGREGDEHPQASAVKDSMRRRDPAFSENDIGFSTFSKFLEDAQSKGIVKLVTDPRSGTYLVELTDGSGGTATAEAPAVIGEDGPRTDGPSEGRRRRRRRRGSENGDGNGRETAEAEIDAEADGEDEGAEVFEFKVKHREPEIEMPPLDQPLSYEDLLAGVDVEDAPAQEEPPTRGSRRRRKALSTTPEPDTADLEAVADEADDEAAPAISEAPTEEPAEDAAPKRGRRRRTSSAASADAAPTADVADEPAAALAQAPEPEAAAEAPAEAGEDAPAPTSRRRVRRGTVLGTLSTDGGDAPAEEPTASAAADDAEAKPKRRRTTAKKATDGEQPVAADTAAAETATEDKPKRRTTRKKADEGEADATATEAPKRRTTRKAADADADAPASAEAASSDDGTADEKPKRRRTTRKKADESAGDGDGISAGESPY